MISAITTINCWLVQNALTHSPLTPHSHTLTHFPPTPHSHTLTPHPPLTHTHSLSTHPSLTHTCPLHTHPSLTHTLPLPTHPSLTHTHLSSSWFTSSPLFTAAQPANLPAFLASLHLGLFGRLLPNLLTTCSFRSL